MPIGFFWLLIRLQDEFLLKNSPFSQLKHMNYLKKGGLERLPL